MAKDAAITDAEKATTGLVVVTVDVERLADPVPFVEPARIATMMPSAAQHEWLRNNPGYVRSSHHYGKMTNRGTLHVDGTFVPEAKHPVMDGPACFGVGVPLSR